MSYPCSPNAEGKKHRMGGAQLVYSGYERIWERIRHPNPGKINFRRSDPRHPKHLQHKEGDWKPVMLRNEIIGFAHDL